MLLLVATASSARRVDLELPSCQRAYETTPVFDILEPLDERDVKSVAQRNGKSSTISQDESFFIGGRFVPPCDAGKIVGRVRIGPSVIRFRRPLVMLLVGLCFFTVS